MSEEVIIEQPVALQEDADQQSKKTEEEKRAELLLRASTLLKRFNRLMAILCFGGSVGVYIKLSPNAVIPFLSGGGLVWINMILLTRGIKEVFMGNRTIAVVILLKFAVLIGGVYLLMQTFPDQSLALLLGCSTWVLSILLVGQGGSTVSASSTALFLGVLLSYSGISEAKLTEAELLEGEVEVKTVTVKGSSMPKIMAEGVVKTPTPELWKIISDCANFSKTMPSIKASKALGFVKGFKRCELVVDLPWPISDLRSVVDVKLEQKPKGVYVRSWSLVEGDYHKNQGIWRLLPYKNGYTLLQYEVHVEPKISIPGFIKRAAQKSKIPDMYKRLRQEIKKRGKLSP